jgi:hypothetical protein
MYKLISGIILLICITACIVITGCLSDIQAIFTTKPDVQWHTVFSGQYGDQAISIEETVDGGYIICGTSYGMASLIKTDSVGERQWRKVLTETRGSSGESMQKTGDGGYVVCGNNIDSLPRVHTNLWLCKTNANAGKIWERALYGNDYAGGFSIIDTPGENYIVTGYRDGLVSLLKIDTKGNTIFDQTYDVFTPATGQSVCRTEDDGYLICGLNQFAMLKINEDSRMLAIKTDGEGNMLWSRQFSGGNYGYNCSVIPDEDSGYFLFGTGYPYGETHEGTRLIKIDKAGNEIWSNLYHYGVGTAIERTSDGGLVICGYTTTEPVEAWILKTDEAGKEVWNINFKSYRDTAVYDIKETSDNGYILCGTVTSTKNWNNILVLKIAPSS